jgi:antitoxin (DNA-binding transcriptional repressor) of toxin-antitoxin stability system
MKTVSSSEFRKNASSYLDMVEKGEEVEIQRQANLAVSVLCLTEIISALCRRRRERFLKPAEYAAAKRALEADLSDATIIQITDEVLL